MLLVFFFQSQSLQHLSNNSYLSLFYLRYYFSINYLERLIFFFEQLRYLLSKETKLFHLINCLVQYLRDLMHF